MNRRVFALVVWLLVCAPVWAEDPVHFPDPWMKAAVEETLWIVDPTPTDMLGLVSLECNCVWDQSKAISDLTGIQHAVNLQSLTLTHHRFNDLSPLSGLTQLRTLVLQASRISDLSPLSGLVNLTNLDLEANQISDISPLASLENLSRLSLHKNPVSDISALVNLPALTWVDLRCDPLDLSAYETCIPALYANQPGIIIVYDSYIYRPRTVTIE
ncbi:MAG TPA: leucine-rich repeat domain-containing protein, partial [Sedimentisphaerales bacterium]|nr:leucine-rich repeat domain-containing protein [Sedimentisphaerales bacterium]